MLSLPLFPRLREDPWLRDFLRCLTDTGYDGCVSIEGSSGDRRADATAALPLLRAWTAKE